MSDVTMSALSLVAYSLGLPAFIAVKVFAPGFYARQDTATPVRIAIKAMVANMVMNVIFVGVLLWSDFEGPHMGLALASSAAAYLNAGLLYRGLRRAGHYVPEQGWRPVILVILAVVGASLVMVALLWWQYGDLNTWASSGAVSRATKLTFLVVAGLVSYGVALLAFGLRRRHLTKGGN
jgi:putative peptidoglycan lipid II flippase